MSAPARRRSAPAILGGSLILFPLLSTLSLVGGATLGTACKPDAPTETATAQNPTPSADEAAEAPEAAQAPGDESATLAAVQQTDDAALDDAALDPPAGDGPDGVADDAAVAAAEDAAAPEQPAVPDEPRRVLILGDSLAATGFGALLERKLDAHPHVVCYRKGKSASGLARPDYFDWPEQAKAQIEFRKPELVVVIMGGNDGQDLTRHKNGTGRRVGWKHEDWASAYRERMDAFLADLAGDDRQVLWLGLPQMGMRSLEKKLEIIRGVQKEAVEALGDRAVYLDTVPFVTTEEGDLLQTAKVGPRGKTQTIRAEDEIHFTMAGSEYFADRVYPEVLEVLGLEDVQAPQ